MIPTPDKLKSLLDAKMCKKLLVLSKKYPQMCTDYLIEMHKVIDWGEIQLRKINER